MFENDNQLMAHLSGYDQSRSRLETILGVRPPLFCALWSLSFSPLIFSVLVPIFIGKMTDSLRHGGLGFSDF